MALVIKDRVQETTTTTGTGTITLAGAVSGFQSFSVIGNSNTTFYSIVGETEWELGIGTYTSSGTTLSRDTILESSNGGTAVNFSAGTKTVFCTYPAERSVYVDGSSIVPGATATLPISSGGTGSSTAAFSGSNITDLNATAITAGTISNNRTTASSSNGASTIVERDATGNFSTNVITANSYSGSGANLTSLNASSVSSGTLDNARTTASSSNGASTIVSRDASGNFTGNIISDAGGNVRTIPANSQGSTYSLLTSDIGKVVITASNVTVPNTTFTSGDVVSVFNNSASNVSVLSAGGVTVYQAGTANTGTRTLQQRGVATVLCTGTNTFVIAGSGIA